MRSAFGSPSTTMAAPTTRASPTPLTSRRPAARSRLATTRRWLNGYVTKLDRAGRVAWSTYLGGTNTDGGVGIGVDAQSRRDRQRLQCRRLPRHPRRGTDDLRRRERPIRGQARPFGRAPGLGDLPGWQRATIHRLRRSPWTKRATPTSSAGTCLDRLPGHPQRVPSTNAGGYDVIGQPARSATAGCASPPISAGARDGAPAAQAG